MLPIIACYDKDIMLGTNWNKTNEPRSKTVSRYFNAVNNIFLLRDYPAPVNFDDKQNVAAVIVNNLECEEEIVTQRKPITLEMFAEIIRHIVMLQMLVRRLNPWHQLQN